MNEVYRVYRDVVFLVFISDKLNWKVNVKLESEVEVKRENYYFFFIVFV